MRSFFSFINILALIFVNTMSLASSPSTSNHRQKEKIIYTPLLGTHFNSSSEGFFYIRVAAFKEAINADNYRIYLSKTLHHSVKIKKQGSYQIVFVGPIRKATEVRSLSHNILALSSKSQTAYINRNKPTARDKTRLSINMHPQFKVLSKTKGSFYIPPATFNVTKNKYPQFNVSSKTKGPFYIPAATFSVTNNAFKYKIYLIQKFHKPVIIKKQGIYKVVLVGPIHSEAEMNNLRAIILSAKFEKKQGSIHNPSSEALRPSASSRDPEIVLSEQNNCKKIDRTASCELAEGRRDCQQTPVYIKHSIPLRRSCQNKLPNIGKAYLKGMAWVNKYKDQYTPLATLSIGLDFLNPGNEQTLTLFPPFQNHYTRGNASQTVADVGMFLGVEKSLNNKLLIQFGVSGYVDAQITPKGEVWQFALPQFNTISYAYHIHNTRFMATSKLLTSIPKYATIHPYLSGELGLAFNRVSGYQETAIEAGAVPMEPFSNASQTSFSWGVGAGIDYFLSQHIRLGMGYLFEDLGSASLNPTPVALTRQSLSFAHLYANQLRFQSTFLM